MKTPFLYLNATHLLDQLRKLAVLIEQIIHLPRKTNKRKKEKGKKPKQELKRRIQYD